MEIPPDAVWLGSDFLQRAWLGQHFGVRLCFLLDMVSASKNHEKAPLCAAFVAAMREAFGAESVEVLFVKENEVELGSRAT